MTGPLGNSELFVSCNYVKDHRNNSTVLEWFSVECHKTKTKVITLANHKEHTQYSEPIKSNYR